MRPYAVPLQGWFAVRCSDASVGCAILDSFVARFSDASESCAVGGVVSGTSHGCFRMLHRIGGQHAGAATVLQIGFRIIYICMLCDDVQFV